MEGRFLSTPAKRLFHMDAVFSPASNDTYPNGSPSKRRTKPPPPPIVASPSEAAFRLLCPASKTGFIIGKSGSVVNQLRQETGAKIRVEDTVLDCSERAVLVVGASSIGKKISLSSGEELEVSPAQLALLKVFDRTLEVATDTEGDASGNVFCRLLVPNGQVGCMMGKGGKVIERIRKDSGAKIRVLSSDQLPLCALPTDEIVLIMGDALAVKKALLAVSKCLQENPSSDKAQVVVSKPAGAELHGSISDTHGSFPNPHGDRILHRSSLLSSTPGDSQDYVGSGHMLPAAVQKKTQEVSFRLLCPNDKVGGVIGKGGSIINALEKDTGASISIGSRIPESEERLISVTATENLDLRHSPAQSAAIRVFTRSVEAGYEKGFDVGSSKGAFVTARLLVAPNQVGCLMGRGGAIIAEMRKTTGASIRILRGDQIPKCASENDEVVQITGELSTVRDALYHITNRLRDNMMPNRKPMDIEAGIYPSTIHESSSYGSTIPMEPTSPVYYPSVGLSHLNDRPSSLAHSMDHLGLSQSLDRPTSPGLRLPQTFGSGTPRSIIGVGKGSTSSKGYVELGSGSKSALVTNTTVDIVVPEHVMGAVYGERGSNLSRIREISGAKVVVHDPQPGVREGMVVISGTPNQTQAAQSLLQAFILSSKSDSHSMSL